MQDVIKFGTDGWRGVIGKDFNLDNVAACAQAIADYLIRTNEQTDQRTNEPTKVTVGYDTRRLSPQAATLIGQVLAGNKIKVILADRPLPVQAISYAVRREKCTVGIMVTASHNPVHFNGIKIKGSFGGPVESEITNQIEGLVFKSRLKKISLDQAKRAGLIKIANLVPAYLKFLQNHLDMPLLNSGRLRILVDAMHGTANGYIAQVLKDSSCRLSTIHRNFSSSFGGIKPEPIKHCLRQAAALIKSKRFDVGLATDGDADRIAALDEHGRFIDPQQIISLLLLHLVRHRRLNGAVVKTISGTALLDGITKKYRLKLYETPVGFKHIARLMQSKNILIGGEEAGGIGFKNYLPERDGIFAGLLLLEMLITENKSLAVLLNQMQKEFGPYVYLRKDIKCLAAHKDRVKERLATLRRKKTFFGITLKKIKDYDGLKFFLADGSWILFRLSGTEPLLRIYAEASSLSKTKKLVAEGERIISS